MWISKHDYIELQKKLEVSNRLWAEEKAESARYRGLIEGKDNIIESLRFQIKMVEVEKTSLMNDLMIASGIRMSKQQELLVEKQLRESADDGVNQNQVNGWQRDMMQKGLNETDEQRNQRAIELMQELERDMKSDGG